MDDVKIDHRLFNGEGEAEPDGRVPVPPDEPEVTEPGVKRGRGRPRKNTTPPPEETITADAQPRRKPRTRKGNNAQLAQQLMGLHKMVAMLPGMEVFEIQPEEAAILADGMQGVADEYNVVMSGKTGAAIQLFAAAAMVYAPRVIHVTKLKNARRLHKEAMPVEPQPESPIVSPAGEIVRN